MRDEENKQGYNIEHDCRNSTNSMSVVTSANPISIQTNNYDEKDKFDDIWDEE